MLPNTELFVKHATILSITLPQNVQHRRRKTTITAQAREYSAPQRQRGTSEGGRGGRGSSRPFKRGGGSPIAFPSSPSEIPVARLGPGQTSSFFSYQTWAKCGADEPMVAALQALGITRPSHIQAAAFRALSTGAPHVVLADHAGSGKTLAYLGPLIQSIKSEEAVLGKPGTTPNCPRVVIVVPTSELCAQVLRVCRALSTTLRFRSAAVTGGRPMRTQKTTLDEGVDVLIGTPGRLAELLSSGSLKLDNCAALVCDEVDVLLGGASMFAEQVAPLKDAAPRSTKWILVTATLPSEVYMQLEPLFPGMVAALGPGLHRTAPGVTEQIVDCSGGAEITEETGVRRKSAALFASLQERRALRSIVFCNKIETCRKVENFLNRTFTSEDAVEVLPYHTAIAAEQREENLKTFLKPPRDEHSRQILVCTDRASRGVDSAFVDHVVLFDFPRDPSEYVRRVGRTARGAGGQGLVTVLVLGRQNKLAQDVIGRNQRGLPVHALPAVMSASAAVPRTDEARFLKDFDLQQNKISSSVIAAAAVEEEEDEDVIEEDVIVEEDEDVIVEEEEEVEKLDDDE